MRHHRGPFSSQVLVSYVASALVGCCYGPLEPSIMAMTSRRFQHAIDSVSSLLIISTNVTSMLVPAAMGLLIPALGINWVMAIPALVLCVRGTPHAILQSYLCP